MTTETARPMRAQIGALLVALRGRATKTAVAEQLGVSRQMLGKLEDGSLSLDRLDEIGRAYGVTFRIVAEVQGREWPDTAPNLTHLAPVEAAP